MSRGAVVKMVDLFEQENSGCFDNTEDISADFCMKKWLLHHQDYKLSIQQCENAEAIPEPPREA